MQQKNQSKRHVMSVTSRNLTPAVSLAKPDLTLCCSFVLVLVPPTLLCVSRMAIDRCVDVPNPALNGVVLIGAVCLSVCYTIILSYYRTIVFLSVCLYVYRCFVSCIVLCGVPCRAVPCRAVRWVLSWVLTSSSSSESWTEHRTVETSLVPSS